MNRNQLILELTRIVGVENVLYRPEDILVYEYDASFDTHTPDVVVLPHTTAQVSQIAQLAAAHSLPLVARGAGTGLSGGAIPLEGGIVMALTRMKAIKALDFDNRRAQVEAGVINLDLVNAAATGGYTYAPDPGSGKSSTIGGNIASNAGGPHCLALGVTANHVLGLTVVLPNGEVIETGGPLADSPGYDLTGVLVGSEGTLGIVTEATTQLLPLAETARTLLVVFETSVADASAAVSDIIAHGIVPTAMEMMDGIVCRAVEAAVHAGYPANAAGVLLIEVEGLADGLDEVMLKIEAICRRHHAAEVRHATTAAERAALWTGRKSALGAMGRIAPNYFLEDGVVPRHRLPQVMALVEQTAQKYNLPIGNFFHAGDGNIHPTILFNRRDPDALVRARQAADDIIRACLEMGGTVSGEHGIGTEKQAYMADLYNQADLDAMADLKACFNPDGRLNPGKIFPKSYVKSQPAPVTPVAPAERIVNQLEGVVGAANLLTADTGAYNIDGMSPALVAKPGTVEEVAALLRYAGEAGLAVTPWGGGAQRALGGLPRRLELVISLERLNQILEHYPSDLTAAFQAGCRLAAANAALAQAGQMLPLDAPLAGQTTLGGIVAAGPAAAGLRRLAYGTSRDMLLGLQFVRPDGRVVRRGGLVVKNVAGYDLARLHYGALGTLGIITQVNFKLYPRPEATGAVVAQFNTAAAAKPALDWLRASRLQPAAVVLGNEPLGFGGEQAGLLLRFEGRAAAVARQLHESAGRLAQAGAGAIEQWDAAKTEANWPALTDFAQLAAAPPGAALLRLNTPAAETAPAVAQAAALVAPNGPLPAYLADAASGVIWLRLGGDNLAAQHSLLLARWPQTVVAAAAPEIKPGVAGWGRPPQALAVMQRLRNAFDPQGILNAGRYLV